MSTRLTYDLTYDAPLTDVGEMLLDPAFRERGLRRPGRDPHGPSASAPTAAA